MKIEKALTLKVGDTVYCPADRGDPPFSGKVTHNCNGTKTISKNLDGVEYIWVEVQGPGKKSMWPSNRLG
jgi:hypothetical protein